MPGTHPNGEVGGSTANEDYQPGEVIADKYRLQDILGAGGMGTVWLAKNLLLEVDVAVKLLHSDFAGQPEASQRFLHEARATAKLTHPSIVHMHDFGTTARGHAFIVMEHLKGEPFADLLERRVQLPALEAVQLLLPVLSALEVAHQHGVVHRDLKPENILLVPDGNDAILPKVVDFGVARVMHDSREVAPLHEDVDAAVRRQASRLTQHGALVGSPQYMAPEQARGAPDVDGRADLWGFSVCLYECVFGERPFDDPLLEKVLLSVLVHEPPKPDAMDDALWSIVKRGLAKNRDERWGSAEELGAVLAEWLIANGVDVDSTGRALRSRWLGEASIADTSQSIRVPLISHVELTPPPALASPVDAPVRSNRVLWGIIASLLVVLGAFAVLLLGPNESAPSTGSDGPSHAKVVTAETAPAPEKEVTPIEPSAPAPSQAAPSPTVEPGAELPLAPASSRVAPRLPTAPVRVKKGGDLLPDGPDF